MNCVMDTDTVTASGRAVAGKYLTFVVAQESYGIPVLKVREIMRMTQIRLMPGLPKDVCGVINVRGKIIPVLDLRRRLGRPAAGMTDEACIVVVQVAGANGGVVPTGLVVDGVEEVVQFSAAEIEPPPRVGGRGHANYLLGLAKVKGVVKALLNIDQVVRRVA